MAPRPEEQEHSDRRDSASTRPLPCVDTYLADAPLAARLAASGVPAELIFGQHDARVAAPPSNTLTHTLLTGVGHTPPWEAADRIADVITTSLIGDGRDPVEQDTQAVAGVVAASQPGERCI